MANNGYMSTFVQKVRTADQSKIGVQLGAMCIDKAIPVTDVSDFFKVSRMTVYSWFTGKTNVPKAHHEKMSKLVEKLQ